MYYDSYKREFGVSLGDVGVPLGHVHHWKHLLYVVFGDDSVWSVFTMVNESMAFCF